MKIILLTLLPVLSVSVLISCVGSGNSQSNPRPEDERVLNQNEEIAADGSNVQGKYAAEIWPVNTNLHLRSIGQVGITRDGDSFQAFVNLKFGPKASRIRPALYNARRCPTLKDDLNKDAYIDILEARIAIGKIMIPFDGDLDSQLGGSGDFPTVGVDGQLNWSRTASFSRLFEDLKSPDMDPGDEMIKLGDDEGITIPGRIVMFQGAPEGLALPETVGTPDGESRNESLPVGCAVLWKVEELPEGLEIE